jgi:uncharacterized protein Yka (UPF0111/DUF47 family)
MSEFTPTEWAQLGAAGVAMVMFYRLASRLLSILDRKTVGNTELAAILKDVASSNKAIELTTKAVAATNRDIATSNKEIEAKIVEFTETTSDLVRRSLPPGLFQGEP